MVGHDGLKRMKQIDIRDEEFFFCFKDCVVVIIIITGILYLYEP